MPKKLWNDALVFRAYELAKGGRNQKEIARILGISLPTLKSWIRNKKMFGLAMSEGVALAKTAEGSMVTFRDYVFDHLDPSLRDLWKELERADKSTNGHDKVDALLADKGEKARQSLFVYAWTHYNFSLNKALRSVRIGKGTFDRWCNSDPRFLQLVREIDWHKQNFFEDALMRAVKGGDTAAVIFANKTKNRDRGYAENLRIDMDVQHTQVVVDVAELDLPIPTLRQILRKMRDTKTVESTQK